MAEVKIPRSRAQRDTLIRMADGWRPFPTQLSGLARPLLAAGLVNDDEDERGRTVLILTERGQDVVRMIREGAP